MARFLKDRSKAKGQAPGELIFIGNQKMETSEIHLMQYSSDSISEIQVKSVEEAYSKLKPTGVNWVNIYGIHDLDMIKTLGEKFKIPSLILEDMVNTDQPPRYEDADDYDIFILKMLHQNKDDERIHAEQITIILGENFVLSLQERVGDVFGQVRERIRKSKGRVRQKENDYLAYVLMDTIADNYTLLIEKLGRKVENLEDRIFLKGDSKIIEEIYTNKIELNYLRKTIRPVKDAMASLLKSESSYFIDENKQYLKDLFGLIAQSTEAVELYNNLLSDQLNIYNANVSNSMNEVMKVLTVFASIFIPLTFIAGIYGMNFEYFPELKYKYAYPIFWGAVIVLVGGLLFYFKKKKWL